MYGFQATDVLKKSTRIILYRVINNILKTARGQLKTFCANNSGRINLCEAWKLTKIKLQHKPGHSLRTPGADRFA